MFFPNALAATIELTDSTIHSSEVICLPPVS
jgi:hypothetical protein